MTAPNAPSWCNHRSVVGDANNFYVFGGVTEGHAELRDVWEFELASNRWRQLAYRAGLPALDSRGGLHGHAAAFVGGKMVNTSFLSLSLTLTHSLSL